MTCKGARSYFANCPQKETTLRSEAICEKPTGSVNCAPRSVRSASVTPRAIAQEPQTYTGISKSLTFCASSLSGGNPTPCTASIIPGFTKLAASPKRAMQQSISALPAPVATRKGSVASVGSSVPCVATYIKGLWLRASIIILLLSLSLSGKSRRRLQSSPKSNPSARPAAGSFAARGDSPCSPPICLPLVASSAPPRYRRSAPDSYSLGGPIPSSVGRPFVCLTQEVSFLPFPLWAFYLAYVSNLGILDLRGFVLPRCFALFWSTPATGSVLCLYRVAGGTPLGEPLTQAPGPKSLFL